jgi:hypothetical protein
LDPEESAECLRQINSKPLEEHDHITIDLFNRLGADLEARAKGEPLSEAHARELRVYENMPLDESPGEGFHRTTNQTNRLAGHARMPWILASVRHKRILWKARNFMQTFKTAGRNVINYEFKNFTRVLQTSKASKWRNKRMTNKAFYKRVYRLANHDLCLVLARSPHLNFSIVVYVLLMLFFIHRIPFSLFTLIARMIQS